MATKPGKSLSEILLESGKISSDKLEKVLSVQPQSTEGLAQRLVDLGIISETALLETLSDQGLAFVHQKDRSSVMRHACSPTAPAP